MADHPQPKKIPLIFFRTLTGSEPVREWLKELPEEERQAIGRDLFASAMALAGWNAAVPRNGKRPLGDSDGFADEAHGACIALHLL